MLSKIMVFILRPFVKPVRYGALKIMKRMRAPDDKRPAFAAADHLLDEIILPSVFNTFRERQFREAAYFNKLPVSEHDRIFNELEVAGVCLGIFYLETAKPLAGPRDFHFWRDVEEYLPKQLQRKLIGYGVDGSNAKLVRELIEMRYKEYMELAERVSGVSDIKPEFKNLHPVMKRIASLVQGIAIGTTDHIRRGKIKEKDSLIQYLFTWLLSLQRKIGRFVKKL